MKKQAIITILLLIFCGVMLCSCESSYTQQDDNTQMAITQQSYEPDISSKINSENKQTSPDDNRQASITQAYLEPEAPSKIDSENKQEAIKMGTIDLMQNISAEAITPLDNEVLHAPEAIYHFAFDIFQNSFKNGENTMLSPISIISALAMTTNGAKNDTLKQMEKVFGISIDELNFFMHNYIKNLPQESTNKLNIANSIWIKNDDKLVVKENFLQKNAAYYDTGIFNADFDEQTVQDINQWIEDNTDGMIKDMLDAIPQEAIMYLINALSFKAEWQNTYFEHQVRDGVFTNSDGKKEDAKLMFSSEKNYLELENAQGFIKFYKDNEYAFAAILPDEGISLGNYIEKLEPAALLGAIKNSRSVKVNAAIPKFESEYSVELNEILQKLGMTDAFDGEKADFTALGLYDNGENNIYISRVLHKTFIALDEKGTEAGAATIVEMAKATSLRPPDEIKTVYLDRPFIYMIIDCENMLPLFIGAIETLE